MTGDSAFVDVEQPGRHVHMRPARLDIAPRRCAHPSPKSIVGHQTIDGHVQGRTVARFDQERLSVEMEITNLSAMSSNSYGHVLKLVDAPPGLATPTYLIARDNAVAYDLHPNMPERVVALWTWPKETPPPQTVQFTFTSQIHKRRDNLYGAPGWFDRPPVARISLPVKSQAKS